jgi:Fe-S-cluster-containing hydrogenase component 2
MPENTIQAAPNALAARDDEESLFSRDAEGNLIRQDDPHESDYDKMVSLEIDGRTVVVPLASPLKDANGNKIVVNGRTVPKYTTIFDASTEVMESANRDRAAVGKPLLANPIPILCHQPHMTPVAVCRMCMVQIYRKVKKRDGTGFETKADRKLLPACHQRVEEGMKVITGPLEGGESISDPVTYEEPAPAATPEEVAALQEKAKAQDEEREKKARHYSKNSKTIEHLVATLTDLLASDHVKEAELVPKLSQYNELRILSQRTGGWTGRFSTPVFADKPPKPKPGAEARTSEGERNGLDSSSPVFQVDHDACIMCDRCVRACGEVKNNHIIGRTGKGNTAAIGFDLNNLMGNSNCVQCGECMVSCPTTAITFKPIAEVQVSKRGRNVEVISAEELLKDAAFRSIPPKFLFWQQGLVVRRTFKAGEVLCRQGEPGNTAFVIKSGKLQATVYPLMPAGITPAQRKKVLAKETPLIVELTPKNFLFGEMSCLSGTPRSADVIGLEDGEVWELRRNVLDRLMRVPEQRRRIDEEYRRHALENTLRSNALFQDLPKNEYDEILSFVRPKLRFARFSPNETICRQGDRAGDLFIVRSGHIRISVKRFDNEAALVISRGPGTVLGEIGLLGLTHDDLGKTPEQLEQRVTQQLSNGGTIPPGKQSATVTALDFLELAQMSRTDALEMVRNFPKIRRRLVDLTMGRLFGDENPIVDDEEFVRQGLYEGRSVLVLDLDRCTRCDECTRGCIKKHGDESHGVPVARMMRDGKRFGQFLVATSCRSCEIPHCMKGCPVDSIHRGKHMQIVIEDHCIGCGLCASNCPYGSISLQPNYRVSAAPKPVLKAVNCDLCDAHDERATPDPTCVASCPHDAAFRMTGHELQKRVANAENALGAGVHSHTHKNGYKNGHKNGKTEGDDIRLADPPPPTMKSNFPKDAAAPKIQSPPKPKF